MTQLTILILGGYGIFGGRLADLLADDPRLTLVVAGRSLEKAQAFCRQRPATACLVPVTLDRNGDLDAALVEIRPDILVDATGPFQVYGNDPYRLVKACLRHGIHYLDFADGSAFARGISAFDAEARAKNLFILSAVSSFPVLTAAVVRHLAADVVSVTDVEAGIAPSPYAGVGPNVIRAIASYAGRPLQLRRDGREQTAYGLTESRRFVIAAPGRLPLHSRRFSLVDVPDLTMIPDAMPDLRSIWVGAAPVPEIFLRALNGLATLVRRKLFPGLLWLAPLFDFVINRFRWGEHRGGMYVAVDGIGDDGKPRRAEWHLIAEGTDGPLIPSMAIAAIIGKALTGVQPRPGARVATQALELADYDAVFAGRTIHAGIWAPMARTEPLYRRVLGTAWERLPQPIKDLHSVADEQHFAGRAAIDRGKGWIARLLAALYRFPAAGADVPVEVRLERRGDGELWRRSFAGRHFSSWQAEGQGRSRHLVEERFGPVTVGLALMLGDGRLDYVVRRWSLLGIPMPRFMSPGGTTFEYVEQGRFHFHVEIAHPWFGLIVRYRGWLEDVSMSRTKAAASPASVNA
jgi:hypothetical protein